VLWETKLCWVFSLLLEESSRKSPVPILHRNTKPETLPRYHDFDGTRLRKVATKDTVRFNMFRNFFFLVVL
jgi:hypothetical protein